MARTKRTRRTYNLGNPQRSENSPREAEELAEDAAQEASVTIPQEGPIIQAKTNEASPVQASTKPLPVTTEVPAAEQEALAKPLCQNLPTVECQEDIIHAEETAKTSEETSAITPEPQENYIDRNDDSLEVDWLTSGSQNVSAVDAQPRSNVDIDDALSISRDSPLNLAWDSSMKENRRQQPNAPNFRPVTPDNLLIPVDEIFSPKTQKEIRTSIRALFPNGPPPPPPVRPMRRPKKGDLPYIVNCTKRPRVPSPKSLRVFTGDKYGITRNTNCDADEEEECTPEKRARRGPPGSGSLSKSTFNSQTNEIAERLKLYEKIDRLVGRTPKEQPVGYMTKRSFSPLPSTSTDNETIMKNDKHFSESLNCDNFDIDDDDDLPEVIWDSTNYKKEIDRKLSSPLVSNIKIEKKDYTDTVIDTNEDMNNNSNDIITIEDEFCEIQFDKFMPKEKILDYSDVVPKKEPQENPDRKKEYSPVPQNQPPTSSRVSLPTTSTDVMCVEDVSTSNILNPISTRTSANSLSSPVLRASNKNATATETRQSDLVIEVPDVSEPINMSRHALRPAWNEDVQFVSEERIERPNNPNTEVSDVQMVPFAPANPQTMPTTDLITELQQFLTCLTESYSRRKTRQTKKKNKRTKSKENSGTCNENSAPPVVNDENTAPVNTENPSVNNENTAPSVNQVQPSESNGVTSANSSPGKRLGECPICLDNLPRGSIASTNCGHVFCLECIKQSLKTGGKRCPTCRKQLKGVGYHQVFL